MGGSRRDRGGATLEWLGMAILAACVLSAIAIVLTGGRLLQYLSWTMCVISGGDCARPGVQGAADPSGGSCQVPPSGPLGSPRGTLAVDLGGGARAVVEPINGGGYRIVVPEGGVADPTASTTVPFRTGDPSTAGVEALLAGRTGATVYNAGSVAETQGLLSTLAAEQEFRGVFGQGDNPLSGAWTAVGEGVRTLTGGAKPPAPASTFQPSSLLSTASENAYALSSNLGAPDAPAEPVGVQRRGDGTSTSYSVKSTRLSGGEAVQFVVEVDRDAGGNIYGVRTTSGVQGLAAQPDGTFGTEGSGSTYVTNLTIRDQADAQAAADLLGTLGMGGEQRYTYPVTPAPSTATSGDLGALQTSMARFSDAASAHGYASRQRYVPGSNAASVLASGSTVAPGQLPTAVADLTKSTAPGEQWTGVAWQAWGGCR